VLLGEYNRDDPVADNYCPARSALDGQALLLGEYNRDDPVADNYCPARSALDGQAQTYRL